MSTRYDLCIVYDDDAEQWSRYVIYHLGREHFRFRLYPVTDRQLLDWVMTSCDGGATAPCLREASESKSFIVIVSPGLVRQWWNSRYSTFISWLQSHEQLR